MRKIEQKYGDRVIVVGVHSPKFPAERETSNLREAVLRHRIEHPVVNDRHFQVWQQFGGRAWPTLVFVDPQGRVIGKHEGELPFADFDPLVEQMLGEFEQRGLLKPSERALPLAELREPDHTLKFPGKVLAYGDHLFIADTNHHRILEASLDGEVRRAFGSGAPAFEDGSADQASFQQPQGLATDGRTLYVADTENHAIRAIHLDTGAVRTLAGTGKQALGPGTAGPGAKTDLSSPWDLALSGSQLFIAMAGSHQISALETTTGEVSPFAGTGREGLQDGPRGEAWFAQSSGLALDGGHLYVADSEVSAVRDIDLSTGMVSALVGEGLFVFGDQDGRGDAVRLQHPLGIAAHAGALFLADSYNHKIKRLDPAERRVQTWAGSGTAGCADGQGSAASFREPGGLSAHERGLFVADTNNHRVALIDWRSASVRTVIGA